MAAPQMTPPPQLTPDQAKDALERIWTTFHQPDNKKRLVTLVKECNAAENPVMEKMQKFPKLVGELLKDLMDELGFAENQIMMGIMQIQMHAAKSPEMTSKVGILMQAFSGQITEDEGETAEAEVCD